MTTGHEHSSLNLFFCDREVVTKRGCFLNYQISCFERWCLAQDHFLWVNMFVTCLSVLPLPSCTAQGCVEWLPCRQGWLEDLWDSFIDFVSCGKTRIVFFGRYLLSSWHARLLFLITNKAHVVKAHYSFCFIQLPSTTVFCGSIWVIFCSQGTSSPLCDVPKNGCWISRKQQGNLLWEDLWNMENGT